MQFSLGNMHETGDAASQVKQGVHLHSGLGAAEVRPRKHRQAQIDGRRIQSVNGIVEIDSQAFAGIEPSCLSDQPLGEFSVNAPITCLVRIGERRAPNRIPKAHVVALRGLRRQTGFDVAQTLPKGKLSKRHGAILLSACERPRAVVATVALREPSEGAPRQKVHKLSEQRLANVHGRPLETPGKCAESVQIDTAPKMVKNPCKPRAYSNLIDRLTGQQ